MGSYNLKKQYLTLINPSVHSYLFWIEFAIDYSITVLFFFYYTLLTQKKS